MAPLPNVRGSVNFLVVRARASDIPFFNIPTYAEVLSMDAKLRQYWQDASKGAIRVISNVLPQEIVLAESAATLMTMSRSSIGDAIRKRIRETLGWSDSDLEQFYGLVGFVNCPCGGGAQSRNVIAGIIQEPGQRGWAWCSKCQSLAFWDESRQPGICAAGSRHDHMQSGRYLARFESDSNDGQPGWRWCSKCECLVFVPISNDDIFSTVNNFNQCPAGDKHDTGSSGAYRVATSGTQATQDQWRRCTKCATLVYGGGDPGTCALGGNHKHDTAKSYYVGADTRTTIGWLSHETGHMLGLDHSFSDEKKAIDPGNDSRPGAYGDNWDIMSYSNTSSLRSASYGDIGPVVAAPTLFKNGWIKEDRVWTETFTKPFTLTIEIVSNSEQINHGLLFARIVTRTGRVFSIEYRTPAGWDEGIHSPGVLIREHITLLDTPSFALFAQNGWRWCSRCGNMVFRGHLPCAAGGVHVPGGNISLLMGPADLNIGQPGWRWCSRCQSLVHIESGNGPCAAGGTHDVSKSGQYLLPWGSAQDSNNSTWRWCSLCKCLNDVRDARSWPCAAGGSHDDSSSGLYQSNLSLLLPASLLGATVQPDWTICRKCSVIYYDGHGRCAADGQHDTTQSSDYFLTLNVDAGAGQPGWRWCSKCYSLAFLDPGRGPGSCPAGDKHDHSSSGKYFVEFTRTHDPSIGQKWVDEVEQPGWRWCSRCEQLAYTRNTTRCPAILGFGDHDFSQSGSYIARYDLGGHGDSGHLQQKKSFGEVERYISTDGSLEVRPIQFKSSPSRAEIEVKLT
ncbi:MAG: hypothetical protein ABI347_10090 [Nitrososphaera sp.]